MKWCPIGSLIKTVQVEMDWSLSGKGSTVKLNHIGSQVASDWPSSGTGLTVKWFGIDSKVVLD